MSSKLLTLLLAVVLHTAPLCAQNKQGSANPASADLALAREINAEVVRLFQNRKYKDALPLAKRVVQIREPLQPPDHEELRSGWRNLAEIDIALEKYEDAETVFKKLIKSFQNASDPRLVELFQRLGLSEFVQRKYQNAEGSYKRAVEIAEANFGPQSQEAIDAIDFLAQAYQARGDYEKAEPLFLRVHQFYTNKRSAIPNPRANDAFDRYSCTLRKLGKEKELEDLEKQRVQAYRIEGGPSSKFISDQKVLRGMAISMPKPAYTPAARAEHAHGLVIVQVIIDETGKVIFACGIKGHRLLVDVSEKAAYGARFTPTKLSGQPIRVIGLLTYNFVAQ